MQLAASLSGEAQLAIEVFLSAGTILSEQIKDHCNQDSMSELHGPCVSTIPKHKDN